MRACSHRDQWVTWKREQTLAERNPYAAEQMQATLEATVEALPLHPYIHRPGRVPGTREAVVHPNYLVVYRVGTERISILDVLHARQEYP
ncbi:type II toxin-antitoxin system RelE/ParE family toxin [Pseudomonas amygdali]|uniref:type II toxin-antitoxin system RelE/ParE family toxin n=1 Tax=Pseudomonas amygdali TaxID=47877 RepID=UPI001FB7FBB4|nr:type II toxin-antitoxin system RelE/ParE family toxin [Pseudomonas amygdali]